MEDTIRLGRGRQIIAIPRAEWEHDLAEVPEHSGARLGFMSPDHHRIRNYVVKPLPIAGTPIAPETIAADLKLSLTQVGTILDELERQLFFLVRNEQGHVAWAFPITVDVTPHQLTFSSGERVYAA